MACDISRVLHTYIRALKTTGEQSPSPLSSTQNVQTKASPSAPATTFSFSNRADSLRHSLTVLADYIRRVQQLTGTSAGNRLRQKMHADLMDQVGTMISQCTTLITQLNEVARLDDHSGGSVRSSDSQVRQHRLAVWETLETRLNALRVLRDMETERQQHLAQLTGSLATGVRSIPEASRSRLMNSNPPSLAIGDVDDLSSDGVRHRTIASRKLPSTTPIAEMMVPDRSLKADDVDESDAAELQTFESENQAMFEHLTAQRDELDSVARAISDIGRLNRTLSTHLTDQLETTQQIGSNFSSSTEQVRLGNEQLRSALGKKASVQFWILFILIVLTFSLHFLDWYYP